MNAVLIRSNGLTISFQRDDVRAFAKQVDREIKEAQRTGVSPIVRVFLSDGQVLVEYSLDEIPGLMREEEV